MLLEIASLSVRAFSLRMVKNLAFSISKNYFIYFNISFYNTLNIKSSIILSFHLIFFFFFFFYVYFILSLCFQIIIIHTMFSAPSNYH